MESKLEHDVGGDATLAFDPHQQGWFLLCFFYLTYVNHN
jgi:hypothetical protein